MISRSISHYHDPLVYYAEASTYLDAMDYIEFMAETEGWRILVPPFVTRVDQVTITRIESELPEVYEHPIEWGFVLHRFGESDIV